MTKRPPKKNLCSKTKEIQNAEIPIFAYMFAGDEEIEGGPEELSLQQQDLKLR